MLHPKLEETKDQGYPAIKALLKNKYNEKVNGIENATITSVSDGARSYGFLIDLPGSSTAKEKKLFLKIDQADQAAISEEMKDKKNKLKEFTFNFTAFAREKLETPEVLKNIDGNRAPRLDIADLQEVGLPNDIAGYEIALMTQAMGQAPKLTEDGKKIRQEIVNKNPGNQNRPKKADRNAENYSPYDVSKMVGEIAKMHQVGKEFLQKNVMAPSTMDFKGFDEVYSNLNQTFGFDIVNEPENEIVNRAEELEESIINKISSACEILKMGTKQQSLDERLNEAKANFVSSVSNEARAKFEFLDNGQKLSFGDGLEDATRANKLTPNQLKEGRQIWQLTEMLDFTKDGKILDYIKTARKFAPIYQKVDNLPKSLLHGDTNPSNFLVDEKRNQKMTLIDWDTLHQGPRLDDLILWYSGVGEDGRKRENTEKTAFSTYDDMMRVSKKELDFSPWITPCVVFGNCSNAVKNFSEIEKITDENHLSKLEFSPNRSLGAIKHWEKTEKVDLTKIIEDIRADSLSGLDLAVNSNQLKEMKPIAVGGKNLETSKQMISALNSKNVVDYKKENNSVILNSQKDEIKIRDSKTMRDLNKELGLSNKNWVDKLMERRLNDHSNDRSSSR